MALLVAALPIALPALGRPPLERSTVRLATGLDMEWLRQPAAAPAGSADVLFVHGSLHGAWCWAEHWMGYLSDAGFTTHAVSLRGTSGSPDAAPRIRAAQHVADLGAFVEGPLADSRASAPPPAIVAHSFGGAYLYEYLSRGHPASAAAFLCPVPPSGNVAMIGRFLRRKPRAAIVVTRGLAFKSVTRSKEDARLVFFDEALDEERVQR
jgi:pimeloyl-ACP methyl ester carboxylesterase